MHNFATTIFITSVLLKTVHFTKGSTSIPKAKSIKKMKIAVEKYGAICFFIM